MSYFNAPLQVAHYTEKRFERLTLISKILWEQRTLDNELTLTANCAKSKFCQAEIKYLGVIVHKYKFGPNSENVESPLIHPTPVNRKQFEGC